MSEDPILSDRKSAQCMTDKNLKKLELAQVLQSAESGGIRRKNNWVVVLTWLAKENQEGLYYVLLHTGIAGNKFFCLYKP